MRHDADGSRNPPDVTDWDALLAGGSFEELGSLRDDHGSSAMQTKNLRNCYIPQVQQSDFMCVEDTGVQRASESY